MMARRVSAGGDDCGHLEAGGDDCGHLEAEFSELFDRLSGEQQPPQQQQPPQHRPSVGDMIGVGEALVALRCVAGDVAGALHHRLASGHTMLGDDLSAASHLRAAFELTSAARGEQRLEVGRELGGVLFRLGQAAEFKSWDLPAAAKHYGEAIALLEPLLAEAAASEPSGAMWLQGELASVMAAAKNFAGAAMLYAAVLAEVPTDVPEAGPFRLEALTKMARVLRKLGDCDALAPVAAEMLERCPGGGGHSQCRLLAQRSQAMCAAIAGVWPRAIGASELFRVEVLRLHCESLSVADGCVKDASALTSADYAELGDPDLHGAWAEELSIWLASGDIRQPAATVTAAASGGLPAPDASSKANRAGAGTCTSADGWFATSPAQEATVRELPPLPKASGVLSTIDFVSSSELSAQEFQTVYVRFNRPVLIDDAAALSSWPAASRWTTRAGLLAHYGDVAFVAKPNLPYSTGADVITLREFVAGALDTDAAHTPMPAGATGGGGGGGGGTLPGYILGPIKPGHPMAKDLGSMAYFESSGLTELPSAEKLGEAQLEEAVHPFLLLGPALSGSLPHRHTAAVNILLRGRKRWHLWPHFCRNWGRVELNLTNVVTWAVRELPALRASGRCAPLEFEQHAGQTVFVPFGWGHAVINLEPTIAISKQLGTLRHLGHLASL